MARTEKTIERSMVESGWSSGEAKRLAPVLAANEVCREGLAQGMRHGEFVAVLYSACSSHEKHPVEAQCVLGQLEIGCPSMVGERLSMPYRRVGGDFAVAGDLVAVLADGTEVRKGERRGGRSVVVAAGNEYQDAMAAAVALTPAR